MSLWIDKKYLKLIRVNPIITSRHLLPKNIMQTLDDIKEKTKK